MNKDVCMNDGTQYLRFKLSTAQLSYARWLLEQFKNDQYY
jgi:hypothetical protein